MIKGSEIIQAFKTLARLENAGNERNRKLALLENTKNNSALKWFFKATYDWKTTYGVRSPTNSWSEEEVYPKEKEAFRNWQLFCGILKALSNRVLTGNKAVSKVSSFFKSISDLEVKWYSRVLDRDLEIGVAFGTFGKVWEDLDNEFRVAKGNTYDGSQKIHFPVRAEYKADGARCLIIVQDGIGSAFSSGGHEYTSRLQHLVKPLLQFGDAIYDGELLATWSASDEEEFDSQWGKTQSMLKTGTNKKTGFDADSLSEDWNEKVERELLLRIFDRANLSALSASHNFTDPMPWKKRDLKIAQILAKLKQAKVSVIKRIPGKMCMNKKELDDFYKEAQEAGYEGIMIKDVNAGYYNWRTDAMLKRKEVITHDYKIVGYFPGQGRHSGRLGALVFDNNGTKVKCGGGFSDKQRDELWEMRDELVKDGWWIEVKFQKDPREVAKNRFPVCVRVRPPDDKAEDKKKPKKIVGQSEDSHVCGECKWLKHCGYKKTQPIEDCEDFEPLKERSEEKKKEKTCGQCKWWKHCGYKKDQPIEGCMDFKK